MSAKETSTWAATFGEVSPIVPWLKADGIITVTA